MLQKTLILTVRNFFIILEQSMRDDLISLSYILVYFLAGSFTWLDEIVPKCPLQQFFDKVSEIKQQWTP